ncbi:hypothetical protein ACR03S_18835 (plasmid) [Limimaricola variabilis]|jgi:hypothetical protein|uniref:hypothetical protein n=1 Tax=Limimaricola sp. AA108-03 TaxID=3425945 RepID=UPI003D77DD4E
MALAASQLAWFCAAAWPVFGPPLTDRGAQAQVHRPEDQPHARLHSDKPLSKQNDQTAEAAHHDNPRHQENQCRTHPLRSGAVSLPLEKQHMRPECAGLDEAEQPETEGRQQRLKGDVHGAMVSLKPVGEAKPGPANGRERRHGRAAALSRQRHRPPPYESQRVPPLPVLRHDAPGHIWHHTDRVLREIILCDIAAMVGKGYESRPIQLWWSMPCWSGL